MEDRVRELLDQEDSSTQRRILSSVESFRRWLSLLGDIWTSPRIVDSV